MDKTGHEKAWLTPQEFSQLSSICVKTVRRFCVEGKLKCRNFGTPNRAVWRIHSSEIRNNDETGNEESID